MLDPLTVAVRNRCTGDAILINCQQMHRGSIAALGIRRIDRGQIRTIVQRRCCGDALTGVAQSVEAITSKGVLDLVLLCLRVVAVGMLTERQPLLDGLAETSGL